MKLVIVESPTKAKTIENFLGPKFRVLSSYGHVRDLPRGEFGIDEEHGFKPKYVIPLKSRKIVNLLKKEAAGASSIILATDEDREGEAIAWHLFWALGLNETKNKKSAKNYERIVFHEITKQAIKDALKNPREIDENLVDAQQARRILDRIVGYKLSPFLWKKVARGLSAGRVQSVAVRLVVEREREIQKFQPQEYWSIEALLQKKEGGKKQSAQGELKAVLIKKSGDVIPKFGIKTAKEAEEILKDLRDAEYRVADIEKKEVKKNPPPPFTTSSLQQEAWGRFHFPAKFTMRIAQNLYEKGFITYHRTDSLNLSLLALAAAKKFIIGQYGKEYWAGFFKKYKAKGRAQEAHEAIRPTYPEKTPEQLKAGSKLEDQQFRIYDLIWRRFIASQMGQGIFEASAADISAKNYLFRATGQTLKFDGFLKVYPIKFEETEIPPLEKEEILNLLKLIPSQHFTKPEPRYTEATLIKALEAQGIGRPSTYAPIISTVQERNYVEKDEKRYFKPTEIGCVVNDILVEHFPVIVDIKFTANMEENFDEIAQGKIKWEKSIEEFYKPFMKNLKQKYEGGSKGEVAREKTEKICRECKCPVLRWLGGYGKV